MSEKLTTNRGFRIFLELSDDYGAAVRVQESSDIEGHVWFFVTGGQVPENKGSSLLLPADARRVADALLEGAAQIEAERAA